MRLINTTTLEVKEFQTNKPEYAILSHRWLDEEISFQQIQDPKANSWGKGYLKVEGFCGEALRNGFDWAWVDTCCIDKTSAVELAEAINSMFAWYRDSKVCYIYMDDFSKNSVAPASPSNFERELKKCVWFTRGWTLQELIAPEQVLFFDYKWRYFGTKNGLADVISKITNINVALLKNDRSLNEFSCAQKMSWAAFRQTTRPEDRAYSLLGLFDITLPSVYGEGHQAFLRLQEAILTRSPDHSLFAWTLQSPRELPTSKRRFKCNSYCILAPSPDCFYTSSSIVPFQNINTDSVSHEPLPRPHLSRVPRYQPNVLRTSSELPYLITNMGLQISFLAKECGRVGQDIVILVALNCYDESETNPCACTIYLVRDVRGVQAQRAEPYCVGRGSTDRRWEGWITTQFLVKPIWIPPIDTSSMRHQTEMQKLEFEAFSRMNKIANRARRDREKKEMEARRRTGKSVLWMIIGGLCCIIAQTLIEEEQ
jgi:hypothetical protein